MKAKKYYSKRIKLIGITMMLFLSGQLLVAQTNPDPTTLLMSRFGVDLQLQPPHDGGTNYSFDWQSFVPTKNTATVDWVEADWYGNWSRASFNYATVQHPSFDGSDDDWYPSGGELYDVEALYFDNDDDYLYIAVVTSVPFVHYYDSIDSTDVGVYDPRFPTWVRPGDLSLNLHKGTAHQERYNQEWYYNYGVDLIHENRDHFLSYGGTETADIRDQILGNKLYHTVSNAGGGDASGFPHNTYRLPDNSDWYVSTPVGAVQSHWEMTNFDPLSVIAQNTGIQLKGEVETRYYEVIWEDGQGGQLLENNAPTAVYEFKIPRNLLGNDNPSAGDSVGIQWASGCRNDGNNTSGLFKYGTIDGQVDLGVQKSVYNAVPQAGEQSVFTITLTNYSQDQTAHHVVVEDILDAAFTYVSSNASTGSYDHVAGEWHLDELAPQSEATLTITVTVQASADNLARLTDLDETDTNPNNNEDWVSVTLSGSSGGNDGGLESNGSLAALIAQRNFSRVKNSSLGQMNHRQDVPAFSEQLAKTNIIIPAGRMKDGINVAALLPEAGPFQSTGYVTTPEDLTRITNANQVFSIDYFNTQDKRMGAILAITTENEVYNHTKAICDRMTGASLDMIRTVMIRDHAFILNKLVESSGSVDYTVSFIAYQKDGKMIIDNRWHNEEYRPGNSDVLNFQVWSVTPQSTTAMVDELLSRLDQVLPLQFHTREVPKVPELFAHNGYYEDGLIHLDIHNPAGNNMVRIKGSLTRYENAPREPFEFAIPVNPDQADQHISLPTGYLFDADFSLANNVDPARDALYYADGPWGRDLDPDGAQINNFTVTPYNGTTFDESLVLERDARISGTVRTYASLFRALKPGNIPVDLTGYGQLVFEATGRGSIELAISKESIKNWSNQYRTQFELEPSWKTYTIDLSQLRSTGSSKLFTPENVLAVVFNALGDGQTSRDFDLQIRNLRFKKGSSDLNTVQPNGFSLNCYPNPFRNVTTLQFNLPDDTRAQILLYNIQGQEIMTIADRRFNAGTNRIELNLQNLEQGIYLVKMNSNYYSETYRLNLLK